MSVENHSSHEDDMDVLQRKFYTGPQKPENYENGIEHMSFSEIKDYITNQELDSETEKQVSDILNNWKESPDNVSPYKDMRDVLDKARELPHGLERVKQMNTIIRTLGEPENLATYLDMLRDSASRTGTEEQSICMDKLQKGKMHSIYGWCGNTEIVESLDSVTEGTHDCDPAIGEKLGISSTAGWGLSIHVWQPNSTARGFPLDSETVDEDMVLEPPHSHPFDFVSKIVKGRMHQSIYRQADTKEVRNNNSNRAAIPGHYDDSELVHVDGVWPPHELQAATSIETQEHRVSLNAGDSYYMPCDFIHDVEIDGKNADSRPTISLFLGAEFMVMPHVYMTREMADYHELNPDIKQNGSSISEDAWHDKLKAISAYLRSEADTLDLNRIVNSEESYAFHNVKKDN